jgi:hypothetical protein
MYCGKNLAVLSHCVKGYIRETARKEFFPFVYFWHGFVAFMALAWGLGEMRG